MNLVAVLGSAGISATLSVTALVSYLFSKRAKRVEHKFAVRIPPYGDRQVIVSAKGQAEAAAKARKLVKGEAEAAAKAHKLVESSR